MKNTSFLQLVSNRSHQKECVTQNYTCMVGVELKFVGVNSKRDYREMLMKVARRGEAKANVYR